jgi:hypothetical protein
MVSSSAKKPDKVNEIERLLKRREECLQQISVAEEQKKIRDDETARLFKEAVGSTPEELVEIDEKIAKIMSRHHHWITRLFSQTVELSEGVVKVVFRSVETVFPKDKRRLAVRLYRVFGEKYVTLTPELNRTAIGLAPEEDLKRMAPWGVKRSRHFTVLVKSPSESKFRTIFSRLYKEPSSTKK